MPLVERLALSAPDAWLPDYVGSGTDFAIHAVGDARVLVRSVREGGRRTVDRWSLPTLRALDRTVFHLDPDCVIEAERYTTAGGPNLHPRPIRLPNRMTLGAPVQPLPGAVATLRYAGPVLFLGDTFEAIALVVGQGTETRTLWSARGVGELCLEGHWYVIQRGAGDLDVSELPDLVDHRSGGRPNGVF